MSNTGIKYDDGKPMLSLISTEMWEAVLDEMGHTTAIGLAGALVMCNRAAHVSSQGSAVVDYLLSATRLLLTEFGHANCMTACAKAMQFGCTKYGRNNWKGGMQALRLIDAMHRHLFAAINGEDTDPESGAKHYGCALFGIQCILHYADKGLPVWDGYPWAKATVADADPKPEAGLCGPGRTPPPPEPPLGMYGRFGTYARSND